MKKSILSIFAVSALLFSSCGENGTSTEVATQQGDVNPNHVQGYGDMPAHSADGMDQETEMVWMQRAEQTASQMATDLQLDRDAQDNVQQIMYEREKKMAQLGNDYNYSETARMGGQANNDTRNDMNDNNNTNMNVERENNANNAYSESGISGDAATNSNMAETEMNTAHSQIKAETERELEGVLSAEQLQKYKQNHEKYGKTHSGSAAGMSSKDGNSAKKQPANQ